MRHSAMKAAVVKVLLGGCWMYVREQLLCLLAHVPANGLRTRICGMRICMVIVVTIVLLSCIVLLSKN